MTCRQITKSSILLLFLACVAVAFKPSAPRQTCLLERTLNVEEIEPVKPHMLEEAAQERVFLSSLGMDETVILQQYKKFCKRDPDSAGLSKYSEFRRKFLGKLRKTLTTASSKTERQKQRAIAFQSFKIDEMQGGKKLHSTKIIKEVQSTNVDEEKETRQGQFGKDSDGKRAPGVQPTNNDMFQKTKESESESSKIYEGQSSIIFDELFIENEYKKWLRKYNKTEATSRYSQFKNNLLLQFNHDLAGGQFYNLNEYADCTEAEAKAQEMNKVTTREAIHYVRENPSITLQESQQRAWDSNMFTPAVRRDIYRVLRNPDSLNDGLTPATQIGHGSIFAVALLTKTTSGSNMDEFAFCSRQDLKHMTNGHIVCDDSQLLQAIACIGSPTTRGIALTMAFEVFLAETATKWGDQQVACLSVEFLVAFGNELTAMLDINHRIRSRGISRQERNVLLGEAFAGRIDMDALRAFGSVSTRDGKAAFPYSAKRWNRPDKRRGIVDVAVRTNFDATEMKGREQDTAMFSSAVRRDIYTILRNPNNVQLGASTPVKGRSSVFGSILLAKRTTGGEWKSFAFADRHIYEAMDDSSKSEYVALSDGEMIEAITYIGMLNPVALAVTEAFERYLSQLAQQWGDRDAARLSVEFLVAFGRELSGKFDVNNRIRSTGLSKEEMLILATEPFSSCVDPAALREFQSRMSAYKNLR
eukprot:scaffold22642_cov134-Cylindrotheca_fusiformis.AAC.44